MALTRRSVQRMSGSIWPGFVDAMTALLLVLMFVLTIFMIVQFILRETISGQETELDKLTEEVTALAQALGLEQQRSFQLENQVGALSASLTTARDTAAEQAALIANLTFRTEEQATLLDSQAAQITSFEAQVATLLAERDAARSEGAQLTASLEELRDAQNLLLSERDQLQLALAAARDEIDVQVEQARLAAARREALEAMIADLQTAAAEREATLSEVLAELSALEADAEATRLTLADTLRLLNDTRDENARQVTELGALRDLLAVSEAESAEATATNADLRAQLEDLAARLGEEEAARLLEVAALAAAREQLEAANAALSEEEAARLAEVAAAEALRSRLAELEGALSEEEATRLAEAAAAKRLREQLAAAEDELTAMTLALEEKRKEAEDTLTLLAAAAAAETDLEARLADAILARDKLANDLAGATQENDRAVLELSRIEAALAAALLERDAISTRYSDEAGKRGDAEARLANLEAELARMTAERDALSEAVSASDGAVLTLSERLAAAETALAAALADAETLRANLGSGEELRDRLAQALAAQIAAEQDAQTLLSEREQREILLQQAQEQLASEEANSAESQRKVALLNEQLAAMRAQLGSLQVLLDASAERDRDSQVEITNLGSQLNVALARLASEEKRRAALEEAENLRLEEEARRLAAEAEALQEETKLLEQYRSEFFGQLRELLAGRDGVQIVGDRFVFSSEVLFEPASATLAASGQDQIRQVVAILNDVSADIPDSIDWIIRVDGHTDSTPLGGAGRYRDNWELSQGRALSVVRFMTEELGFAPSRLAATGFGEFRPVAEGDTLEAHAQNRRIELKLTER